MAEPITEVWRLADGMSSLNGLYGDAEIAQRQLEISLAGGFRHATLQRLPLATPEMVASMHAAASDLRYAALGFECDARTLLAHADALLAHAGTLDAARAGEVSS